MKPAALLTNHRTALLGAGAAAAVLLGLRARKTGGSNTTAAAGKTGTYTGAGAGYDSTANDVYNSIEPQIEALATQINALGVTATPAPQQALQPGGITTTNPTVGKNRGNTRHPLPRQPLYAHPHPAMAPPPPVKVK